MNKLETYEKIKELKKKYPYCSQLKLINEPLVLTILKFENEKTKLLQSRKGFIESMLDNIEEDTKNIEYYKNIIRQLKEGETKWKEVNHFILITSMKRKQEINDLKQIEIETLREIFILVKFQLKNNIPLPS